MLEEEPEFFFSFLFIFILVSYVGERPRWPIQCLNKRNKEESKRLRGEKDQSKFIHLGFERWQVVRFRKARGRQDLP